MEAHIDRHFDDALTGLKVRISTMSSLVEAMLGDAVLALEKRDQALANAVIDRDAEVDALEMEVDELSLSLLARYQPAGSDLRFISRGLKITTELERVGDLARNIAKRVLEIIREGMPPIDLSEMSTIVQGMLHEALESFFHSNVDKAEKVLAKDDTVDRMTRKFLAEVLERSIENPKNVKRYFPLSSVVRNLERIADHGTNIAEITIFMVKGRDVRHGRPHE